MTQPPDPSPAVLTSQRVLDDTMTLLASHSTLPADGYRCTSRNLFQIVLTAVAQQSSIEAACTHLATAPTRTPFVAISPATGRPPPFPRWNSR